MAKQRARVTGKNYSAAKTKGRQVVPKAPPWKAKAQSKTVKGIGVPTLPKK